MALHPQAAELRRALRELLPDFLCIIFAYDACAGVSCNTSPGQCYEAAGTCSLGVCSYAPKASGASCDDGNACTGADACNGAWVCSGSATSCSNPPGQCYEAAGTCSGGACSYAPKAAGSTCNDGNAGTLNDVSNGVCMTVNYDSNNCGGCGNRCPWKFPTCYQGACENCLDYPEACGQ